LQGAFFFVSSQRHVGVLGTGAGCRHNDQAPVSTNVRFRFAPDLAARAAAQRPVGRRAERVAAAVQRATAIRTPCKAGAAGEPGAGLA